jgi:hypothetical protein
LLDEVALVAAPCHVYGAHFAGAESEAGYSHRQEVGRVDAGFPAARVANMGTVVQRAALGRPLPAPLSGEVQDLGGPTRQGQQSQGAAQVVGRRTGAAPAVEDGIGGALVPVLGVAVIAAFILYYWLPITGETAAAKRRRQRGPRT